jgi:hypothetical protein
MPRRVKDAISRRNVGESMRDRGGAEQKVAGANCGHLVRYPVTAGAGGEEIQFVAEVWNLRAILGSGGEPYFQVSVNEHLSRAPGGASAAERDVGGGV